MTRRLLAAFLLLALPGAAGARTIVLTAEDCDQMAFLSAKAPRLGWAGMIAANPSVWSTESQVQMWPDMAILLRFDLSRIPKGQRITKAELTANAEYVAGPPVPISVRRILAEWGTGVCHQYRTAYPKKVEWASPGARGAGTDRAPKDTAVIHFTAAGEQTVDVTEDIELWYTGGAANRGWVMTIDTSAGPVYLSSPCGPHHGGSKRWKLQITFEPQ